jgi:hypothetical protein
MKWKVWFKVCNDDKWYTNNKEWDTETAAVEHARDKFRGWTQAESWMVLQSSLDANNDSPTKSSMSGGFKGW